MKTSTRIGIVAAVVVAAAATIALKRSARETASNGATAPAPVADAESTTAREVAPSTRLPKLLDLGADKCIPCKMMAPILEELKKEYAGVFDVQFIDVWKNPDVARQYRVEMIPTQIFFDANGTELYRHTGFFGKEDILAKWQELGVDVKASQPEPIVRLKPLQPDTRARDQVCFMCDGDVNPKSAVQVRGQVEQRILCSPHCYFIYFSSIPGADPDKEAAKVWVTDWETGEKVKGTEAVYLYGMDERGRPTIRAFAAREAAERARQTAPGVIIDWNVLRTKELATRCGFCDRAVYPEDACKVTVAGTIHTYGCCTHCAMGVAARTGKDIEVEAYDGLTGEVIRVRTLNGKVASIEPPTAIAWFGQKQTEDGRWVSAGCFKQGFFVNRENLRRWLDQHPTMTGREITIAQALADKMKLTPEQIARACKLGECK
ncbi:MAG: hypothetical protein D6766_11050 [Verrucomicrobia bacterium]|nr:MAG: hypothetical protein D6766_11050 [Verrucomicrobiota bacterium]